MCLFWGWNSGQWMGGGGGGRADRYRLRPGARPGCLLPIQSEPVSVLEREESPSASGPPGWARPSGLRRRAPTPCAAAPATANYPAPASSGPPRGSFGGGPWSSPASWPKSASRNVGSTRLCASEKLPRLTGWPHTSRCTRSRALAAESARTVRQTGLTNPNKNRLGTGRKASGAAGPTNSPPPRAAPPAPRPAQQRPRSAALDAARLHQWAVALARPPQAATAPFVQVTIR